MPPAPDRLTGRRAALAFLEQPACDSECLTRGRRPWCQRRTQALSIGCGGASCQLGLLACRCSIFAQTCRRQGVRQAYREADVSRGRIPGRDLVMHERACDIANLQQDPARLLRFSNESGASSTAVWAAATAFQDSVGDSGGIRAEYTGACSRFRK